jgi:DNA-directed RNA polymerase subunit E'/Rpb7
MGKIATRLESIISTVHCIEESHSRHLETEDRLNHRICQVELEMKNQQDVVVALHEENEELSKHRFMQRKKCLNWRHL